ncbi:MAG: peptidoglycan-binding protein, partial [Actinomycetota bacterium]
MSIEQNFGTIRSDEGSVEHGKRLVRVCRRERLTVPQTAYVLATAQHETRMGRWMIDRESGWAYEGRHHLGNTEQGDGPRFRGRGYVPLVGRRQYAQWERRLGLPLVDRPELAAEPDIAAEILVRGMTCGTYTGHRLADYLNENERDYVGARRIIRDRDRAGLVARLAEQFEALLRPATGQGSRRREVMQAQRHLRVIGWPLVADGILGTFTRRAVTDFQRGYTFEVLPTDGNLDQATAGALERCAAGGGWVSPHFRFAEFRTGGSHQLSLSNRVISVRRPLVHALERYRQLAGEPVRIASGYRSVGHNATGRRRGPRGGSWWPTRRSWRCAPPTGTHWRSGPAR